MAFHGGENVQLTIGRVDIWGVIKEVEVDGNASYGPRLTTDCGSIQGWWDRAALKRVLENLVSNAINHGSPEQ